MRRTKIQYENVDNYHVKILSIEHCCNEKDIEENCGEFVLKQYLERVPFYYRILFNDTPSIRVTFQNNNFPWPKGNVMNNADPDEIVNYVIYEGSILYKREFDKLVEIMKESGKRLISITGKKVSKVKKNRVVYI